MSSYTKQVSVIDVGVVSAAVYGPGGYRIDARQYFPFCFSLEAKLRAAHAWADRVLDLCIKYQVNVPTPPTNNKEAGNA